MKTASSLVFKLTSQGLIAVALSGIVLQLPGCGGGGTTEGAPLNPAPGPAAPLPLTVNPGVVTLYVNQPTSLLVTGGVPPYRAFSSNPTLLPLLQDVIGSTITLSAAGGSSGGTNNAAVTISVTDSAGNSATAAADIVPTPFLDKEKDFKIVGANCTNGSVCAGQTATASVTLRSPTGAPLAGRQVRFEALQGQYNFVLDDAATQLTKAITVTTDAQGLAIVRIKADVNAITSFGLIRATDLVTGSRLDNSFPVVQVTDGKEVLTVSPSSWTITGAFKGICSSGAEVGYYIFGGTPPYRVVSSVPDTILVGNLFGSNVAGGTTTVLSNGGYFTGRTNGGCIINSNAVIFITDATGRTVGVGLENSEGKDPIPTSAPVPVGKLVVTPPTVPIIASTSGTTRSCAAGLTGTQTVLINGGVSPYRATVVGGASSVISGGSLIASGAYSVSTSFVVQWSTGTNVYPVGTVTTVTVVDSAGSQAVTTINCT